jgi:hypothetical protein
VVGSLPCGAILRQNPELDPGFPRRRQPGPDQRLSADQADLDVTPVVVSAIVALDTMAMESSQVGLYLSSL